VGDFRPPGYLPLCVNPSPKVTEPLTPLDISEIGQRWERERERKGRDRGKKENRDKENGGFFGVGEGGFFWLTLWGLRRP